MEKLIISRVYSGLKGTFGVIQPQGAEPFALTAELPWNDNERNISCIPSGVYSCRLYDSPKFGFTYIIDGVPGRSGILFHKGNAPTEDSRGCILIGEQFECVNGKPAIAHSGKGFSEFISKLNGAERFELLILNYYKF